MPIDPTRLPALEQELIYSKQVKAGGQLPDKGRTAAIEAEIALHRAALEDSGTPAPEQEQESNVSTDYSAPSVRSDDPATKAEKRKAAAKKNASNQSAGSWGAEPETADDSTPTETPEAEPPAETVDATETLETA